MKPITIEDSRFLIEWSRGSLIIKDKEDNYRNYAIIGDFTDYTEEQILNYVYSYVDGD